VTVIRPFVFIDVGVKSFNYMYLPIWPRELSLGFTRLCPLIGLFQDGADRFGVPTIAPGRPDAHPIQLRGDLSQG